MTTEGMDWKARRAARREEIRRDLRRVRPLPGTPLVDTHLREVEPPERGSQDTTQSRWWVMMGELALPAARWQVSRYLPESLAFASDMEKAVRNTIHGDSRSPLVWRTASDGAVVAYLTIGTPPSGRGGVYGHEWRVWATRDHDVYLTPKEAAERIVAEVWDILREENDWDWGIRGTVVRGNKLIAPAAPRAGLLYDKELIDLDDLPAGLADLRESCQRTVRRRAGLAACGLLADAARRSESRCVWEQDTGRWEPEPTGRLIRVHSGDVVAKIVSLEGYDMPSGHPWDPGYHAIQGDGEPYLALAPGRYEGLDWKSHERVMRARELVNLR